MIFIHARFIEVPPSFLADVAHKYFLADVTNGTVLTNPNFQIILHEVMVQEGVEEIADSEAVTLSGSRRRCAS